METLELRSYAKVNLVLNVLEKRPQDGYHDVSTIMVPISLADTITLSRADSVTVACDPDIAGPADANLAYRAACLLRDAAGYRGGAAIAIEKVIPVAGGLAGGSTNAGAVLRGLNELWGIGLAEADLIRLAIQLGSDVPFFIAQRPALVEGIGERITPVPMKQHLWFVLATPSVAKSTGNVYRLFDELDHVDRPDVPAMAAALASGDPKAVARSLGNVFEGVMLPRHPEIAACKAAMLREGAIGVLMSGAGPTLFGLVAGEAEGRRLLDRLRSLGLRTFLVSTVGHQGE
jgi:4-diphosphocytidyl-2-C-methyl-D-erythritol kinase